jgi:hypothetical protein
MFGGYGLKAAKRTEREERRVDSPQLRQSRFRDARWEEKGGADPAGRRADMRPRRTRGWH